MEHTINKYELLGLCQRIGVSVINRLNEINQVKYANNEWKTINNNLAGECNRAAILFYVYLFHDLHQKMFTIITHHPSWYQNKVVLFDDTTRKIGINPFEYFGLKCELLHGELAHDESIPPEYWPIEHTIVEVIDYTNDVHVYVDLTCKQFRPITNLIPDSYVDFKLPWWIYPDRDNPEFNKNKSGE